MMYCLQMTGGKFTQHVQQRRQRVKELPAEALNDVCRTVNTFLCILSRANALCSQTSQLQQGTTYCCKFPRSSLATLSCGGLKCFPHKYLAQHSRQLHFSHCKRMQASPQPRSTAHCLNALVDHNIGASRVAHGTAAVDIASQNKVNDFQNGDTGKQT